MATWFTWLLSVFAPVPTLNTEEPSDRVAQEILQSLFDAVKEHIYDCQTVMTWRGGVREYISLEIYELPAELLGGADDGMYTFFGYEADLQLIGKVINAHTIKIDNGSDDEDGPCIFFKGTWKGRDACIFLWAEPPQDEPATFLLDEKGEIKVKEERLHEE